MRMIDAKKMAYLKLIVATGKYRLASKALAYGDDEEQAKLALALSVLNGDHQTHYEITAQWDIYFATDEEGIRRIEPEQMDIAWLLLRCHGDIGFTGLNSRSLPLHAAAVKALPDNPFVLWAAAIGCADRNRFDPEALTLYERALQVTESMIVNYDAGPVLLGDSVLGSFPKLCFDLARVLAADLWEAGRFPNPQELYLQWEERLVMARLRKTQPTEDDIDWLIRYLNRHHDETPIPTDMVAKIYRILAKWLIKEQHTGESALQILEQANAYLFPDAKQRLESFLGTTYYHRGQWEKAVYWLQRTVLRQKKNLNPLLLLARGLEAWQHEQRTNENYRRVRRDIRDVWGRILKLEPDHGEAALAVGVMEEEDGRFLEAKEWYEKAIAGFEHRQKGNTNGYGRACLRLGLLLYRINDAFEAQKILERASSLFVPDSQENRANLARALYYLGEIYRGQDDHYKAESTQRQALTWDPNAAEHLRSEWERISKLGEGGFAEVWKVRHRVSGQMGAMKVLKPSRLSHDKTRKRFKNEAILTMAFGGVNHFIRGLPESVDFTRYTFVVELLDCSLKDRIYKLDEKGDVIERYSLTEDQVRRVLAAIGTALSYLHGFGSDFIHRDVKPANIMVSHDLSIIRLADFGTLRVPKDLLREHVAERNGAKVPQGMSWAAEYTLVDTWGNLGTPPYTAPEVIRSRYGWGEPGHDQRADIFSLGATLFEIATGFVAFTTGNDSEEKITEILQRVLETTFIGPEELGLEPQYPAQLKRLQELHSTGRVAIRPRGLNPAITEKMEAAILRCLEKEPDRRYRSVRQLMLDLGLR